MPQVIYRNPENPRTIPGDIVELGDAGARLPRYSEWVKPGTHGTVEREDLLDPGLLWVVWHRPDLGDVHMPVDRARVFRVGTAVVPAVPSIDYPHVDIVEAS